MIIHLDTRKTDYQLLWQIHGSCNSKQKEYALSYANLFDSIQSKYEYIIGITVYSLQLPALTILMEAYNFNV